LDLNSPRGVDNDFWYFSVAAHLPAHKDFLVALGAFWVSRNCSLKSEVTVTVGKIVLSFSDLNESHALPNGGRVLR
jgi:hypothetical protein